MRQKNINEVTVVINNNNDVCNKKYNCENAVTAILPKGSSLKVYYPGAESHVTLIGGQ
ncbi:DddA-like double-stranded DNA deaminase toxin [Streptomyces sp. NPDC055808]|uniref:DddA-like double-stranded DNA deaminase toxin n=1 Tax=Streptomyces sp. NPDC001828 TaxID=3364615 RepID=UPI0036A7CE71